MKRWAVSLSTGKAFRNVLQRQQIPRFPHLRCGCPIVAHTRMISETSVFLHSSRASRCDCTTSTGERPQIWKAQLFRPSFYTVIPLMDKQHWPSRSVGGSVVYRKAVKEMGNIFIERRDDGRYTVEKPGADRASAIRNKQAEAIARAKDISPNSRPDVERVRHTSVGKPDQWRKA